MKPVYEGTEPVYTDVHYCRSCGSEMRFTWSNGYNYFTGARIMGEECSRWRCRNGYWVILPVIVVIIVGVVAMGLLFILSI